MERIKNFDIVINKCLWEIKPTSETLDLDKNDFLWDLYVSKPK